MDKTQLGPDSLLFPTPAVLVGAMVDGRANFMTAAWCGVACSKPPAISVSLRKQRHTFKGIMENRTFSINIPSVPVHNREIVALVFFAMLSNVAFEPPNIGRKTVF